MWFSFCLGLHVAVLSCYNVHLKQPVVILRSFTSQCLAKSNQLRINIYKKATKGYNKKNQKTFEIEMEESSQKPFFVKINFG